jgi:hypothetical protein
MEPNAVSRALGAEPLATAGLFNMYSAGEYLEVRRAARGDQIRKRVLPELW